MIKSMTGFGKGKAAYAGGNIQIELKTFNHKYFEAGYKLPDNLQEIETQVKNTLKNQICRGKLYLWVHYEQLQDNSNDIIIDQKKLKRYYKLLNDIKKQLHLKDEISLAQLTAYSDIIVTKPAKENKKALFKAANMAISRALAALIGMRKKEGLALYKDLNTRAQTIEKSLQKISVYLPEEIKGFRVKLNKKAKECADKNGIKKERIEAEVALFAKSCDIAEEITRLKSHLANFKSSLKSAGEVGKVLDFIAQEIQREINTIGAKSSDFRIAKEVIKVKGEVEKIREQVQNVE
ncbi:MAG: YicC family protein [Candidatus Omnitrophica bacterium]|nr:YicC family protein [Candidatus Omnitrophota bacterium]